jgi:hypothetical protein
MKTALNDAQETVTVLPFRPLDDSVRFQTFLTSCGTGSERIGSKDAKLTLGDPLPDDFVGDCEYPRLAGFCFTNELRPQLFILICFL